MTSPCRPRGRRAFNLALLGSAVTNRPMTLVIGDAPGGGNDVLARLVAGKLSAEIGLQVIEIPQAARFDPLRSYSKISGVPNLPYGIVASPSFAAKAPKTLVAMAKENPTKISYPSPGYGNIRPERGDVPARCASEADARALPRRRQAAAGRDVRRSPAHLHRHHAGAAAGEVMRTRASKEIEEAFSAQGAELRPLAPTELKRQIAAESKQWNRVIKATGAKLQ